MFLALIRTMTECGGGGGVLRLSATTCNLPPATLREKREDPASFHLLPLAAVFLPDLEDYARPLERGEV